MQVGCSLLIDYTPRVFAELDTSRKQIPWEQSAIKLTSGPPWGNSVFFSSAVGESKMHGYVAFLKPTNDAWWWCQ